MYLSAQELHQPGPASGSAEERPAKGHPPARPSYRTAGAWSRWWPRWIRPGSTAPVIVPPSWAGESNDYALESVAKYPSRFAVMGRGPRPRSARRAGSARGLEANSVLTGIRLTFNSSRFLRRAGLDDGTLDWFWATAEGGGRTGY